MAEAELSPRSLQENLKRVLGRVEMPSDFVVFDLETTDLEPRNGRIWQLGLYQSVGGRPVEGQENGLSIVLKIPETVALSNQFEIRQRQERIIKEFGLDPKTAWDVAKKDYLDHIETLGVDPREAVVQAVSLLTSAIENGFPIVGHNLIKFDVPYFEYECRRFGLDFSFPIEGLIDTGMLIKAAKLGLVMPDHETSRQFFSRVGDLRRKGVYYAIERFCVPYWDMVGRYGVDLDEAHAAGYDCWLTALILENLVADAADGISA